MHQQAREENPAFKAQTESKVSKALAVHMAGQGMSALPVSRENLAALVNLPLKATLELKV